VTGGVLQFRSHARRLHCVPVKAITALIVLRDKAIKPLLAAAQGQRRHRGAQNPTPLDAHYANSRLATEPIQKIGSPQEKAKCIKNRRPQL
jgi:hypothetical protein